MPVEMGFIKILLLFKLAILCYNKAIKLTKDYDEMYKDKVRDFISLKLPIIIIMVLAGVTRLVCLGKIPNRILPDEAYAAYNAYSLMREGIDSRGYNFPVYFVAWGSGMNVLYSYLVIPFLYLFGTSLTVYRIPQAIIGILGVYAFYIMCRDIFNRKYAYFMAFVLAINPWHILTSRFGLESNLAPGVFLIGLCFLVEGIQKNRKYLVPAAVFLGAVLYCYAVSWIMVPVFLVFFFFCYYKRLPKSGCTIFFVVIIFILALPLLFFVGINVFGMEEIRTSIISIPKLNGFRGSEIGVSYIIVSIEDLIDTIINQYDYNKLASSDLVGGYYYFTTPFMVIGIFMHCVSLFKNYKRGQNQLQYIFLLWLLSAVVMSSLISNVHFIHINLIHIPIIFYGSYGILKIAEIAKNRYFLPLCIIFLCCSFMFFALDDTVDKSKYFDERTGEVIEVAKNEAGEGEVTIVGHDLIRYSLLLWHEKPSAQDFCQNAVYEGDSAWADLREYGRFKYISGVDAVTTEKVCIISATPKEYEDLYRMKGFEIKPVNNRYSLAVKE